MTSTSDLSSAYSDLYTSVTSGETTEVLASLRAMIDACPEVAAWLAKEAGIAPNLLGVALEVYAGGVTAEYSDDGPCGQDIHDMEALLDSAAAYGTLDDVMDLLCETDPKDAEILRKQYGLGDHEPVMVKDIAAEMGVSREWVRRCGNRGRMKVKQQMEARGVVNT
jgi:hypothetical protein